MADEMRVQDGQVVSMEYILHVDGQELDASRAGDPLQFIQGEGQIIRGLEQALYGMGLGDSKKVQVSPEEGYGQVDDHAVVEIPRSQIPPHIALEEGMNLPVRGKDGSVISARVEIVTTDRVRLNFNHPLAGKELHFEVKIVALRPATEEEKAHGHIHS